MIKIFIIFKSNIHSIFSKMYATKLKITGSVTINLYANTKSRVRPCLC